MKQFFIDILSDPITGGLSSKRLLSLISGLMLIVITVVFLIKPREWTDIQYIFTMGFWVFLSGSSQYLTLFAKKAEKLK